MARLDKTETATAVIYTGELDAVGMVLTIEKDPDKISLRQTLTPTLVGGKTWQQLVAEIDAANTVV